MQEKFLTSVNVVLCCRAMLNFTKPARKGEQFQPFQLFHRLYANASVLLSGHRTSGLKCLCFDIKNKRLGNAGKSVKNCSRQGQNRTWRFFLFRSSCSSIQAVSAVLTVPAHPSSSKHPRAGSLSISRPEGRRVRNCHENTPCGSTQAARRHRQRRGYVLLQCHHPVRS